MNKWLLLVALGMVFGLAACSNPGGEQKGYTKEDFKKTGPPPEYRGPGQPGAPPSGPVMPKGQ